MRGMIAALLVSGTGLYAFSFRPLQPEFLRDPAHHTSPALLPATGWKPVTSVSQGYDDATWWVRFRLTAAESRENLLLEHSYASTDTISLFVGQEGIPRFSAGDRIPHRKWPYSYHNPVLPVPELDADSFLYLKIRTSSAVMLTMEIISEESMIRRIDDEKFALGIFYGLVLTMAIYNLFLFITTRQQAYAWYVVFILCFNIVHGNLNGISFQFIWPDLVWWANTSLPFFATLAGMAAILFARSFLGIIPVTERVFRIMLLYGAITTLLSLFLPYSVSIRMSHINSLGSTVTLISHGVLSLKTGIRSARFYLMAWSFMLFGILAFVLKALGIIPANPLTNWSMQIGSAAEVILLSLGLADKINLLSEDLEQKVSDLEISRKETDRTASLMRELFDASEEMIFLTDTDLRILSGNKSIKRHLGYSPEEVTGLDILTLFHSGDDPLASLLVMERFEEVLNNKGVIRMKAPMKFRNFGEAREMDLVIQLVKVGDRDRLLISARPLAANILHAAIRRERTFYEIGNSLQFTDLLASRLVAALPETVTHEERLHIRLGLREMLINAVEHGNLGITFEDKTRELDQGTYLSYLQAKQKDPVFRNRKVQIEYILRPNLVAYRITDQGDGFDHARVAAMNLADLSEAGEAHGRGVAMTRSVFDRLVYNQKGNRVTLVKFFRQT